MSATTPPDSPRPHSPSSPPDASYSNFSRLQSHSQPQPQPQSQPQPQPQMRSRPGPQRGMQAEGTQHLALPATSDAGTTSPPVVTSRRPKLVRRDCAVDLTAARQQFEYTRMVKQARAGKKLDIATPGEMGNLIHWLESGVAPNSLHLECDFGGPHCYEDPDYDNREVLDGQLFNSLLQTCGGIRKLVFEECRLSQGSFHTLATFLMQEDCKLEVLSLIDEQIDDKSAGHLAKALRSNRSLHELSVGGALSRVSSTAMAMIINAVASTPSIAVLRLEHIRGCMIWPWQLESVLASGSRVQLTISSPKRVRLHLQDPREWNATFAEFCERLATDTALRSLDLSGFDLNEANIAALLAALQRNAHLERLELGRIALTDEQRALITRCLELNESNNQVARQVAEWQAAKALDRLVPALLAPGDVWPHELSQLIAAMMEGGTLEEMKKSGVEHIAPGNPKPSKCTQS